MVLRWPIETAATVATTPLAISITEALRFGIRFTSFRKVGRKPMVR
jgi:hypothetical protein